MKVHDAHEKFETFVFVRYVNYRQELTAVTYVIISDTLFYMVPERGLESKLLIYW